MSRKTISIKMPSADPSQERASSPEAPAAASALDTSASAHADSDRWIRAANSVTVPDNSSASSTTPAFPLLASATNYATIDLSADRTFAQVLALSTALPSMLGWFWLANAFNRYLRRFAI